MGKDSNGAALVPLEKVRIDGETQSRAALCEQTVKDYAAAMERGESLPPAEAVFDGADYWLWDGFHRYHAAGRIGYTLFAVLVRNGTVDDARWLAWSANKKNQALRRTNADKRKAVEGALRQKPELSDTLIAEHVGVDDKTVAAVRKTLTPEIPESTHRTGKDGRKIDTSNIGKKPHASANGTGPPPGHDAHGRSTKPKPTKKVPAQREQLLDKTGAVVPDNCRDAFADPGLADLAEELANVEAMLSPERWRKLALNFADHYPWLRIADFPEHVLAALDNLQLARADIADAIPHAVCIRCKGTGKDAGKPCRGCRGCGHVPEHRHGELERGEL